MKFSFETLSLLAFVLVAKSVAEESPTRESYIPEKRKSWNSYEKQFQGCCQMLRHFCFSLFKQSCHILFSHSFSTALRWIFEELTLSTKVISSETHRTVV